ncbi:hypothetical protein Mgra_00008456 [Meloidogyne graminicola]|uniref:Alpha N-terminal protein methyltransferase 1 n=1 Tax=Meloidogyne graminicola TaxID=189291 RepID=A0A8S9ZFQ0_9BILA|nr:hypothetical protein Mgra_00008456 [Meloidogyne graminicola]
MDEVNYEKAYQHWSSVTSNVEGMLGGYERLHLPDVNYSKKLLDELTKKKLLTNFKRALDCGCGIGRITKHLLLPTFTYVDMVDFAETFIEQSNAYISDEGNSRIENKFVESLHTFKPEKGHYDLIWIQWVIGQLSDVDLTNFLRRCQGITNNGCIVIKDNVTRQDEERIFDQNDNSWTRPLSELRLLIENSGLNIVLERRQLFFPKNIFPVYMFVMKPSDVT